MVLGMILSHQLGRGDEFLHLNRTWLAMLLLASLRLRELVARLPTYCCRLICGLPSQGDSELRHHRVAAEIHLRIVLVAGLVIVLGDVVAGLLLAPLRLMTLVLVTFAKRERRYSRARKAEVIGPIIMSCAGLRIRHNRQAKLFGGTFDRGIERGALGARYVDLLRHSERGQVVIVQVERNLLRRNRRMQA